MVIGPTVQAAGWEDRLTDGTVENIHGCEGLCLASAKLGKFGTGTSMDNCIFPITAKNVGHSLLICAYS